MMFVKRNKPLGVEFQKFETSCQSSRTYPHREWQRTLRVPWLLQSAVYPAWRWPPSHTPDGGRGHYSDVARIIMTAIMTSNLDHLDHKEEGERKRNDDHYHGDDSHQHRAHPRPLLASWKWEHLANYVTHLTVLPKGSWLPFLGDFSILNCSKFSISEAAWVRKGRSKSYITLTLNITISSELKNFNASIWGLRGQVDLAILGVYRRQTSELTQHSEIMYNCPPPVVNTFSGQTDLLENSIQWWNSLNICRISKVSSIDWLYLSLNWREHYLTAVPLRSPGEQRCH